MPANRPSRAALAASVFYLVLIIMRLAFTTAAPASERTVSGASTWEPDRELAAREADQQARAAVQAWLEQTLGTALGRPQLVRWLDHPEVVRNQQVERRERAYGELWRATVSYTIAAATWERWRSEHELLAASQRRSRLVRGGLSLLAVVATVGGLRLWDRRTQGYDRLRIGLVGVPLSLAAYAAIWLV